MVQVKSYTDCSELDPLEVAWDRLCEKEPQYVPSFAEMRHTLQGSGTKFRMLTVVDRGKIVAMACFIFSNTKKAFYVVARRLFELPVREASLFGSCMPGQPSEDVIRRLFQIIIDEADFDLISVGEIFIDTPLHNAIKSFRGGTIAWSSSRKKRFRWMINLPNSFDEYMVSLGSVTRRSFNRDCRKFDGAKPQYRIFNREEAVEEFLRDAEQVSKLTYQSKLGYGVCDDERTRERLSQLAKLGQLRCYIAYLNDKPCAFGWGALAHRTFAFQQTGYDPQFRHLSPGTSTIMYIIRDLIENTNCRVFDFLQGGETGYKSRLCPVRLACAEMHLASRMRPSVLFIVALDRAIVLAKQAIITLAGWVIGSGTFNRRIRKILRPLGIVTY